MRIYNQCGTPGPRTILAVVLAATLSTTPALADAPAEGGDIAFGARPGNVIGTGSSLPISDQASNITEANTHSRIAPRLPPPQTISDSPHELLRAAVRALDAGRSGEAQEALERAETRLLSRSVPAARIGQPSAQPLVSRIGDARRLLADGYLAQAARLVETDLPPGFQHAEEGAANGGAWAASRHTRSRLHRARYAEEGGGNGGAARFAEAGGGNGGRAPQYAEAGGGDGGREPQPA